MDFGFAWGTDGEFGEGVDVYIYMNEDGFLAAVHVKDDGGAPAAADAATAAVADATVSEQRNGGTRKTRQ